MKENIKELFKYKLINKLKLVERLNSVGERKESPAEHTRSSLILADYYLNKLNKSNPQLKINRLKIYELLMYHDLNEIHAGDFPLHPKIKHEHRQEKELAATLKLQEELPDNLSKKYKTLFIEYEEKKTIEAKFARAIDVFDAQIHEIDYKQDWKGWTKEFLINKKLKHFEEFPELKQDFLDLCEYLEEEGYFSE
ncbi:MAG: HD domain-containing protein [Candidatus Nanoarchaeia archaeon]